MSDEQMPAWCRAAAEAITDEWQVGTASRFMDDPPDWDPASVEDIAETIWEAYQDAAASA